MNYVKFSVSEADVVKDQLIERNYQKNIKDNAWEKVVAEENRIKEAKWLSSHCLGYVVTGV